MYDKTIDLLNAVALLLWLGILVTFACLNTFYPDRVVQFLARFSHSLVKGLGRYADKQIRNLPFSTYDRTGKESFGRLIERGAEHPEEFPSLMKNLRRQGYIVWAILLVALLLLLKQALELR